MTNSLDDAAELLKKVRMDLTNAQAKITDAMNAIASVPRPRNTEAKCPECGIQTRGPLSLAEHVHTSHGGPLPDHWARAEQLAGLSE